MADPATEQWRQALARNGLAKLPDSAEPTSARLRRMEQERDEARRLLGHAQDDVERLDDRLTETRHWLDQAQVHNRELAAERDAAHADRDAVSLIADELRHELTASQAAVTRLGGLYAEVRQELDYAHRTETDLRAQLERRFEMHTATRGEVINALTEKDRLRELLDECIARFGTETERLHGLLDQARRSNESTPTKEN